MCEGCNACGKKCGNEIEIIERMKNAMENPKRICMNQQTYEAISGKHLELCGLCVDIDNRYKDHAYLVLGE